MPCAMESGERDEVRGVSGSVSKRAGADHHGKGWSATGVWRKPMVVCVYRLNRRKTSMATHPYIAFIF